MAVLQKDVSSEETTPVPMAAFGRALSRTRFIVVIAVVAVMLMAVTLFLLGSLQALVSLRDAWVSAFQGQTETKELTVQSLEIVGTMLKAVVFYLVGVGLYSLFIAPLNITVALGVESLNDLESKVLSVIVVIMSTTFLEHFVRWQNPTETLQFGAALALVVAALVFFQRYSHHSDGDDNRSDANQQAMAKHQLFHTPHEHLSVQPPAASPGVGDAAGEEAGDSEDEGSA